MNGQELDLGNQAFDAVLGRDMNNTFGFSNGTLVTEPSSPFVFSTEMTRLMPIPCQSRPTPSRPLVSPAV